MRNRTRYASISGTICCDRRCVAPYNRGKSYFREIVALANDEPDLVAGVFPRLSRGKDSPSISDVTPQEGFACPEEGRGALIISSSVSEISSERNTDDADDIPTAERLGKSDASEPAAASCGDGPVLVGAVMGLAGNPGSITDTTGTHWAHALQSAREVLDSVTPVTRGGEIVNQTVSQNRYDNEIPSPIPSSSGSLDFVANSLNSRKGKNNEIPGSIPSSSDFVGSIPSSADFVVFPNRYSDVTNEIALDDSAFMAERPAFDPSVESVANDDRESTRDQPIATDVSNDRTSSNAHDDARRLSVVVRDGLAHACH